MRTVVVVAVVLCLVAFAAAASKKYDLNKKETKLFVEWLKDRPAKFNEMRHSREELIKRFLKFRQNVGDIKKLNAENKGEVEFGLTELSDLDDTEYFATKANAIVPATALRPKRAASPIAIKFTAEEIAAMKLPASFDWRKSSRRVVSPVKNQGRCGMCWTFAVSGNVEGRWSLTGHSFKTLSEEHLLDCSRGPSIKHCSGGWPGDALTWIASNGLASDKQYPFRGTFSKCKKTRKTAKISNWGWVDSDPVQLQAALKKYGPLSIIINADKIKHYKRGVVKNCGSKPNHAVLLVGWTTVKNVPAWIVKNSWGTDWGTKGYFYIQRSGGDGICGVNKYALTAI